MTPNELMKMDGVEGVGEGLTPEKALCYYVYTSKDVRGLPETMNGKPVLVRQSGKVRACAEKP